MPTENVPKKCFAFPGRCSFECLYLVAILVGLIGTGLFYFLFPTKYEAEARFYTHSASSILIWGPDTDYENFLVVQLAIIKSPQLLEGVVNDPRLVQVKELHKQKNPVEWLHKSLSVTRIGKSEIFSVSYRDSVPENAQAVIATVVDAYLKRHKIDAAASKNRFHVVLEMEPNLPMEPCTQPRLNLALFVGVGSFWLTLLAGIFKQRSETPKITNETPNQARQ